MKTERIETHPGARVSPLRIFLVEDHPATREGLRTAIDRQPDMRVAGEASTRKQALAAVEELSPDVLVLDLNLPDGNGWLLLDQLSHVCKLPPTLVLSVCDEALYAKRLLRSGACGYLMKDEPIERVLAAIRAIASGVLIASPAITSQLMAEAISRPEPQAHEEPPAGEVHLSDRELQVLGLRAQGRSNKEAAAQLDLSEKTVSTYKVRMMKKLGLSSTPELITRFARTQGQ